MGFPGGHSISGPGEKDEEDEDEENEQDEEEDDDDEDLDEDDEEEEEGEEDEDDEENEAEVQPQVAQPQQAVVQPSQPPQPLPAPTPRPRPVPSPVVLPPGAVPRDQETRDYLKAKRARINQSTDSEVERSLQMDIATLQVAFDDLDRRHKNLKNQLTSMKQERDQFADLCEEKDEMLTQARADNFGLTEEKNRLIEACTIFSYRLAKLSKAERDKLRNTPEMAFLTEIYNRYVKVNIERKIGLKAQAKARASTPPPPAPPGPPKPAHAQEPPAQDQE